MAVRYGILATSRKLSSSVLQENKEPIVETCAMWENKTVRIHFNHRVLLPDARQAG